MHWVTKKAQCCTYSLLCWCRCWRRRRGNRWKSWRVSGRRRSWCPGRASSSHSCDASRRPWTRSWARLWAYRLACWTRRAVRPRCRRWRTRCPDSSGRRSSACRRPSCRRSSDSRCSGLDRATGTRETPIWPSRSRLAPMCGSGRWEIAVRRESNDSYLYMFSFHRVRNTVVVVVLVWSGLDCSCRMWSGCSACLCWACRCRGRSCRRCVYKRRAVCSHRCDCSPSWERDDETEETACCRLDSTRSRLRWRADSCLRSPASIVRSRWSCTSRWRRPRGWRRPGRRSSPPQCWALFTTLTVSWTRTKTKGNTRRWTRDYTGWFLVLGGVKF